MHRAWKRRVAHALAALAASVVAGPSAWAFHAGTTFETPASAGGGDSIYYSGAPSERGWKCDLCHTSPEGKISVHVTQPELFGAEGQRPYTPGMTYQLDVELVGEHLGLGNAESNDNSIAVQILDAQGRPAGNIGAADNGVAAAPSTYVYDGVKKGATHWTFKWFAPGATDGVDGGAPGKVTFYVSAVDGNGAGAPQGVVLNVPFGDDFFFTSFDVEQGAAMMGEARPAGAGERRADGGTPAGRGMGEGTAGTTAAGATGMTSVLALAAFGMVHRMRRRRG